MAFPRVMLLQARSMVAGVLLLVGVPASVSAQQTGSIRGRVVDAATERPLVGAQVVLAGTGRGGVTNAAGEFVIENISAAAHTVRVEMIGYATAEQQVTVAAGEAGQLTFELAITAVSLDEVVVTGTPGATSKRTLGNSITTLNAAEITERTAITNLTELLQAKTPGVQIMPNSGTLGAAADIRIRGAGSLTQIKPVIYIDGVRYNNDDLGTFTPSGAGTTSFSGQAFSAFDLINPEDIESIEVIKGPSAATLYGAEAANGVIQIITKKGRRGEQAMSWQVRTEYGQNDLGVDIPDNYTTCSQDVIDDVDDSGNPIWPGCQAVAAGTLIRGNPLRDDPAALRNGPMKKLSVSARGGGERYSFFISGDINEEDGVFHNNYNDRRSVRANFTLNPNDWLDLTLTSSYARGSLRVPVGDEAAQGMLLSAFRGRPGRVTSNPLNAGWSTTRAEQANAYDNTTRSDRLTLGATVNAAPLPWFRNRLTVGLDYTSSLAQVLSPPGSVDADYAGLLTSGVIGQRVPRNYLYTFDYSGNVDRPLTADLSSTTSFGFRAESNRYEQVNATGTGLGAPDITLISAAATTVGGNTYRERKSVGLFVQEQLAWKNRLFLTGAVRADDNSSFGESFDWIYYPKAGLSWVISEEPALASLFERVRVNDLKLRAAWGEAGQAPAPFSATQIYTVNQAVRPDGTVVSALQARAFGNPDLVAERGTELELGFDAALFNSRAGIEFTFYNKRMSDVIISTSAPGSSGFAGTFYGSTNSILTNLGETLNTGVELSLTATPLLNPRFAWDVNLSLATNSNELVDFGDDRTDMVVSGQSYGAVQRHREGYPIGGYWYRVPVRDANGDPVVYTHTDGTRTMVVTDELEHIGTSIPKREISLSNTFTLFGDFRVFVLFDHKGGHHLFNYKEYNRCAVNANCEGLHDAGMRQNADTVIWRSTSSVTESSAAAGSNASAGAPLGYWIEKADFIKLRDLSLTYTLPSRIAQAFRATGASITVAGHNLAQWTDYSGLDPEASGYGPVPGRGNFARADVYPVPMLRRWSVAMNLSF
ncbi:MAG: SusC/RagA family TonB-linked outer membrane protein [Longimicrobiales bacterium]